MCESGVKNNQHTCIRKEEQINTKFKKRKKRKKNCYVEEPKYQNASPKVFHM